MSSILCRLSDSFSFGLSRTAKTSERVVCTTSCADSDPCWKDPKLNEDINISKLTQKNRERLKNGGTGNVCVIESPSAPRICSGKLRFPSHDSGVAFLAFPGTVLNAFNRFRTQRGPSPPLCGHRPSSN